jgi:UDP-N-acetylmuramoyl-tripeptide--D-alanyl-D-alanine ligase
VETLTLKEIREAVSGEIILEGPSGSYSAINTDTRKIAPGDVFIALKGENFNGNRFLLQAVESGASLCIVDEVIGDTAAITTAGIIKVADTRKALLDLAGWYRKKLKTKIVGITGSTGKTSTKDLAAAALGSRFKVFKTKGNFNNEIGLPLMIFSLDNSYDIAVLEMGMNNLQEIHRMAEAARPDIALITNVGVTHIGNLKTRENILKAKLEITDFFGSGNTLVVNSDSDLLQDLGEKPYRVITTSAISPAEYSASGIELGDEHVSFSVSERGELSAVRMRIDVPGRHTVNNALLAIACARLLGLSMEEIAAGFGNLQKTAMRLDIIRGEKFTIINDCYNANPDSMKSGIDVLKNLESSRRAAILGTMGELGDKAEEAHRMVGKYAKESGIDLLITLGDYGYAFKEGFGGNCFAFSDYDEAVDFAAGWLKKGDAVLVKASRSMKFENVVEKLKQANHI